MDMDMNMDMNLDMNIENEIYILDTINPNIFTKLFEMLQARGGVPKVSSNTERRGFGETRALAFGNIRNRGNGYHLGKGLYGLSYYSTHKKWKPIYEEIVKIGKEICPIPFTSIYLNNNKVCPPHKDTNNCGLSMLVSFGDYEGCNIVIEGKELDARKTPLIFDGSKLMHYNTPLLNGTKYSLVYFSMF
jgi:hypothetical protein